MPKKKIEFVLKLPYEIEGNKFHFFAEDETQAEEMLSQWLVRFEDVCSHPKFKAGKCVECDFFCEHDWESGVCTVCRMEDDREPMDDDSWQEAV